MFGKTKCTKLKRKTVCCGAGLLLFIFAIMNVAGCGGAPVAKEALSLPATGTEQAVSEELAAAEYNFTDGAELSVDSPAGSTVSGLVAGEGAAFADREFTERDEKRYVILQARLTLEIEDLEAAARKIQDRVKDSGGYLVSLEFYDLRDGRQAGQLAVRVPADRFDPFWESLDGFGTVKNPHVYTDDVTMHYIDLEARLKNLVVQEERMRDLLARAKNVEEILQIEKELGRIRGDLEGMTAEFKHLQERVRYSSLEIRLEEKDPRVVGVAGGFGSFGERINRLLSLNTNRLLKGLSTCLIVGVGSLPLLVPLLLLVFLGWKAAAFIPARKKISSRKKDKTEQVSS